MSKTGRELKREARRHERGASKYERIGAEQSANGHAAIANTLRNAAKTADGSDWDPRMFQTVRDLWDQFLTWLFHEWGFDDTVLWAPHRPNSPRNITARVKARIAQQDAAKAEAETRAAQDAATADELTRQHDAPTSGVDLSKLPDLDAIAAATPTPPASTGSGEAPTHRLDDVIDPAWCNCTGKAHEAHCAAAQYFDDFATGLDDIPSPSNF